MGSNQLGRGEYSSEIPADQDEGVTGNLYGWGFFVGHDESKGITRS